MANKLPNGLPATPPARKYARDPLPGEYVLDESGQPRVNENDEDIPRQGSLFPPHTGTMGPRDPDIRNRQAKWEAANAIAGGTFENLDSRTGRLAQDIYSSKVPYEHLRDIIDRGVQVQWKYATLPGARFDAESDSIVGIESVSGRLPHPGDVVEAVGQARYQTEADLPEYAERYSVVRTRRHIVNERQFKVTEQDNSPEQPQLDL